MHVCFFIRFVLILLLTFELGQMKVTAATVAKLQNQLSDAISNALSMEQWYEINKREPLTFYSLKMKSDAYVVLH